ncbi:MAG: hypothetical protein QGH20_09240, partial [Candidatus Latescibacteria bacterium]|nr:hypothetical protein [Candidatus Latescibacterota bacterium]
MPKHDSYDIHVVSNTHWDREWVYPSAETRLLLIEFMDNLLKLLDEQPEFHSFLMDSQTLCVQDYLEWRPEMRETVVKHVTSGRLVVGPWCSLPEEYIVSGESLVRNLVIGHRVAGDLGKVSKLGYTPFGYGQTSQMPQIYQGFDIDTMIFYRGINTKFSEFIMRGPDGSEVIGTRFGAVSRFSYFFYIYRMVAYNMTRDDWEYRWQRGALPFRLAGEHHGHNTHYYITDPDATGWHTEHIEPGLKRLMEEESEHFTTKYMVCMQGFDSSEPDAREMALVELCQEALGNEHNIFQSDLGSYMEIIKEAVKSGEIEPEIIDGESRNPGATGKWTHLYG